MNWSIFIAALIMVESGGNDAAVGDAGLAVGCLQIHPILVEDVNRISGRRYTLQDRRHRAKSIQMALIYLRHYCTPHRLGHPPTWADYARTWNGGPRGPWKPSTLAYWRRIRSQIDSLRAPTSHSHREGQGYETASTRPVRGFPTAPAWR